MSQTDKKCPPDGNLGIPVEIQGTIDELSMKKITKDSPFIFQFIESRITPMTLSMTTGFFDESDKNTIIQNGEIYQCIGGQVCEASTLPVNSVANICLWFRKKTNPRELIYINIPIMTTDDTDYIRIPSITQTYLQSMAGSPYITISGGATQTQRKKPKSLQELINALSVKDALSYATCIDLKNDTSLYVQVLQFDNRDFVQHEWWNRWVKGFDNERVPQRRVPVGVYSGTETVLRYRMQNGTRVPDLWSDKGFVDKTVITANSTEFLKRITYYPQAYTAYSDYTANKTRDEKNNYISQYKCVRLNPGQDITNGYVTIDPITGGRTMDNVLDDQNRQITAEQLEIADAQDRASIQPGDIGRTVGILIGVVAAVSVVGWIIMKIAKGNKASVTVSAVTAAAAASTAAAASAVGSTVASTNPLKISANTQELTKQLSQITSTLASTKKEPSKNLIIQSNTTDLIKKMADMKAL